MTHKFVSNKERFFVRKSLLGNFAVDNQVKENHLCCLKYLIYNIIICYKLLVLSGYLIVKYYYLEVD